MIKKSKLIISVRKKPYTNFFISFLFILSFFLILFNKTDYILVNKIKGSSIDYITPITSIISSPVSILNNAAIRIYNIQKLESKNLRLQEEVLRLKKWQTLAIRNSRENRVFKKLLNSTSHQVEIIKTVSVINQSHGIYSNLITVNAGSLLNIKKDFAVINEKGLVGKVVFIGNNNSRVLLINDSSSSVPVRTLSDGAFSILSGTSDGRYLKSSFIKNDDLPRVGDLLVTSGNAKIFPRDILVAKVIQIKDNHYVAIPYVDFSNLNYVQIVKSK